MGEFPRREEKKKPLTKKKGNIMANMLDKFAGMSTAQATGSTRIPQPEVGKSAILLNSVRMHENRKGGFRVEIQGTTLWGIAPGKKSDGTEAGPNETGDKVSVAFFSGDYFHRQFKEFCLKVCGIEPHEDMKLCDILCPADDAQFKGKSDLDRLNYMWDVKLPAMVCAFNEETGEAEDAGAFDGQRVIQIGTVEKSVHKKINPKGEDEKSNWVHDADGQPIVSVFKNTYFNDLVPFGMVEEKLSEDEIKQFFGSVERFEELKKEND